MQKTFLLFALLVVSAVPARAGGDEGDAPPSVLEMGRATVLASPGCPSALHTFLPAGKAPARLAWPLPHEGSLLVLGLPESDDVARRIADVFQLDVEPDTLAGGYAVHAWQDGRRNFVFVFGADPAALYAARFEFEASAPVEMIDPNMRSLDFKKPNQNAGLRVRAGNRIVRPRYRNRALAPGPELPDDVEASVSGARGSEIWIDERADPRRARRVIARARALGVLPVVVLHAGGSDDPGTAEAHDEIWADDPSLKHFALVFETPLAEARSRAGGQGPWEAREARAMAKRLRGRGQLERLIVVPRFHSDRLAQAYGAPPDLREIPEASIAWSGPTEHSTSIPRAAAAQRVREAGVPVVLLETWAAPYQQPAARRSYVPSLPTGRPADLGALLAGVVVLGTHGTEAILESAWDPAAEPRFGSERLEQIPAPRAALGPAWLVEAAGLLGKAAKEDLGLVPWMGGLADELRALTARPMHSVSLPSSLPAVRQDGALDEDAWRQAGRLPIGQEGVTVRLLRDGPLLRVAVEIKRDRLPDPAFLLQLRLAVPGRGPSWHLSYAQDGVALRALGPGHPEPGHVTWAHRSSQRAHTLEITFDRFALGGDLHSLRTFDLGVSLGPANLWPVAHVNGRTGTLVVR